MRARLLPLRQVVSRVHQNRRQPGVTDGDTVISSHGRGEFGSAFYPYLVHVAVREVGPSFSGTNGETYSADGAATQAASSRAHCRMSSN